MDRRRRLNQYSWGMMTLQVIVVIAGPAVETTDVVLEGVLDVRVGAVPGRAALHEVRVAHDARHAEHHLVHHVQVVVGDEIGQVHGLAHDRQHDDDHGEAGEDGARHEVGREDGHVPARHQRRGEVERHDRVYADDEARGQARKQQVGLVVVDPVRGGAAPAHAEHGVDALADAVRACGRAWTRSQAPARGTRRPATPRNRC